MILSWGDDISHNDDVIGILLGLLIIADGARF